MTDAAKASVWAAVWQPWGGVHSKTGTASLDARLPGQWFQAETGLHYNWHRQYDPTVGRYTQPDPLGFVDGPSLYGYAKGAPQALTDFDGRQAIPTPLFCFSSPQMFAICTSVVVIGYCMASPGNVADTQIVNDWAADTNRGNDKCEWLRKNAHKYRADQVKRTEKAWGCRRSRYSCDNCSTSNNG